MRILHLLDHSLPLHSGYVFRTMGILRAQRGLGWETLQLTTPKQLNAQGSTQSLEGFDFHRTPPASGPLSRIPVGREISLMAATAQRLEALAEQTRPDLIHAHSPVLNALPALRVGRRLGIPVVYEVRGFWEDAAVDHGTATAWGPRYRLSRALETYALRRAAAATTISQGLHDEIIGRGVSPEKLTIIPNSVDLNHFATLPAYNSELAESLGLSGSVVVGFIGSFYAYEGLDLLIQALPRLIDEIPSLKVVLVGGGPEQDRLVQLVREKDLEQRVTFTGRVAHDLVSDYYGLIDVLLYPRRGQRLTELVTPLKPLEAMANGKVLLASDVGGHRELIDHGKTGFLFRADDLDDLVRSLVEVVERREAWPDIQRAGRAFVEHERTWQSTVKRYQKVYTYAMEQG